MTTKVGMALVALGLGAATLTGCGGGGSDFAEKSADDIVKSSKSDMKGLESVKVSGTVTSDDQEITIDMQSNSGGDCTGSIGVDEGTAELLGVDGETWMRPDEAFWRSFGGESADQILSVVGDKWVVIGADEDSFNQFCDVDKLLDELLKDEEDGSTYKTVGTDEVDGDDVVKVENNDPEDGPSIGYVLTDDPHYLVKVERTEGDEQGSVTFSAFDEEFEVEAPADDEVVDLNSLG
ncbi:hypothetical protein GON03_13105 [Nocardioides sp. MAH-18]|uniref:Lipoprotein n=1 Tax=Nocardioides agri TaxID=2682843 RepID=A0A6L6XTL3_9ACTN|nr:MULTISPECIES: hypothetical protein [unclassified Nocardioides]MBA2955271.1 hypothetical protein [Nocardioides sp. CGMCC 1.13656]MVQ50122.1 hypothetical protein [Nocardioides sp. MAH-18]